MIASSAKHQTAGYHGAWTKGEKGVDWTSAAPDSASSISKRAHAIAQGSRRDPKSSMLERLIQQKEERVADLETLWTRRDQAKAECIVRFPPINPADEYLTVALN